MTRDDIQGRAGALAEIVKSRFLTPAGLLARHFPPGDRTLFDNFDDLAPFFLYLGEEAFLVDQIARVARRGETTASLLAHEGRIESRHLDEWVGGLYAVWRTTRAPVVKGVLDEALAFVRRHLLTGDGRLPAAVRLADGRRAPYWEPWSAGLLEVCAEMREDVPDLFDRARDALRGWVRHAYFAAHGLFPYRIFESPVRDALQRRVFARRRSHSYEGEPPRCPPWSPGGWRRRAEWAVRNGWYSFLMKSNSTPAFTLLTFFEADGDRTWAGALDAWIAAAMSRFVEEGTVFQEWYPAGGVRRQPSEVSAFILCDVLCDAAAVRPAAAARRPAVKRILDAQWAARNADGLIPYHARPPLAHLDSQVDWSVTMRRYAERSGEVVYRDRARELMTAALAAHDSPDGYRTYSGPGAPGTIDPKYNALALKGLINLMTLEQPLYPGLHGLFKDR
jgi:hypothetical protein